MLRQSFTERFDQIEGSLRMTSHRSKSLILNPHLDHRRSTEATHPSGKRSNSGPPRDPIYLSSLLSDGDCGQVVKMESSRRRPIGNESIGHERVDRVCRFSLVRLTARARVL